MHHAAVKVTEHVTKCRHLDTLHTLACMHATEQAHMLSKHDSCMLLSMHSYPRLCKCARMAYSAHGIQRSIHLTAYSAFGIQRSILLHGIQRSILLYGIHRSILLCPAPDKPVCNPPIARHLNSGTKRPQTINTRQGEAFCHCLTMPAAAPCSRHLLLLVYFVYSSSFLVPIRTASAGRSCRYCITCTLITCTFCTLLLLQRAESSAHTQGHLLDWTSGGPLVPSSPHAAVMPPRPLLPACGSHALSHKCAPVWYGR